MKGRKLTGYFVIIAQNGIILVVNNYKRRALKKITPVNLVKLGRANTRKTKNLWLIISLDYTFMILSEYNCMQKVKIIGCQVE